MEISRSQIITWDEQLRFHDGTVAVEAVLPLTYLEPGKSNYGTQL